MQKMTLINDINENNIIKFILIFKEKKKRKKKNEIQHNFKHFMFDCNGKNILFSKSRRKK
jgi:hypothetical protein